jgi:membrane associated rhomboid family serine protease
MFVPLCDTDNAIQRIRFPFVTWLLIGTHVAVFTTFQSGLVFDQALARAFDVVFGVIPVELTTSRQVIPETAIIPESLTLFTYMFLHGGWFHLGGNMLFLWTFGDNVEDAVGHWRYLVFYLVCGVSGALVHVLTHPSSVRPLVGASGAVAGLVMAYLLLHPRVRLWCLVAGRFPLHIDARFALSGWVATQVFFALQMADDGVAWWAHIGGIVAGGVLIVFMRLPGVPLLDQGLLGVPVGDGIVPKRSIDAELGTNDSVEDPVTDLSRVELDILNKVQGSSAGYVTTRPALDEYFTLRNLRDHGYLESDQEIDLYIFPTRWKITDRGRAATRATRTANTVEPLVVSAGRDQLTREEHHAVRDRSCAPSGAGPARLSIRCLFRS